ncbi:MAG: hypothetical protein DHS20C11_21360 [Lysobacteraceae bacterium]|nr:MAG: hypothetical protein DHS20C11_21360 [Xanthomonadaceae bacterium]
MQRYKTVLVLALTILMPSLAAADTCPLASSANVNGRFVSIVSTASGPGPNPIADFIGTGCTAAAFGPNPPAGCRGGLGSFSLASFFASWPGAASNTTANGCTFTCNAGGTGAANVCQMRGGDGLPVELMEFTLDDQ